MSDDVALNLTIKKDAKAAAGGAGKRWGGFAWQL